MDKTSINELEINGVIYVPKKQKEMASNFNGMPFVLIRTYSAGVHFGYMSRKESTLAGMEVTLKNSRRIYTWEGAATLSQIAMEGVKDTNSSGNKITMEIDSIDLVAIEIIAISDEAQKNLAKVKIWKI